jgi:D-arabinose 1-dehydrogenase-like Zn-dependent alcohol dehydrogenase
MSDTTRVTLKKKRPKCPETGWLIAANTSFYSCDPEDPLPGFPAFAIIVKTVHISGSCIGSPREIEETLQFIADRC